MFNWNTFMKIRSIVFSAICFLLSQAAYAKNVCNDPSTIQEAKVQLGRALNLDAEEDGLILTNVEAHSLTNGGTVCSGKLSSPKFETLSIWQAAILSGVPKVSVIQAIDPTHFTTKSGNEQAQ